MDFEKKVIAELEVELSELEQKYALAFEAGENPYFLNAIWKKIKDIKMKMDNQ